MTTSNDGPRPGRWTIEHRGGDIVTADADVIVNAWNRNFMPRWLLKPAGVSKVIRHAAGDEPFDELRRHGLLQVGQAVATSPGRLPLEAIVHVAGINARWKATEDSIRTSVTNTLDLASEHGWRSVAMPLIGSGTGGFDVDQTTDLITAAIDSHAGAGCVQLWRFDLTAGTS